MIYKEKGKEEHTLISLLPEEDLGWCHERRHGHRCGLEMAHLAGYP
jgi:hypothetical protein